MRACAGEMAEGRHGGPLPERVLENIGEGFGPAIYVEWRGGERMRFLPLQSVKLGLGSGSQEVPRLILYQGAEGGDGLASLCRLHYLALRQLVLRPRAFIRIVGERSGALEVGGGGFEIMPDESVLARPVIISAPAGTIARTRSNNNCYASRRDGRGDKQTHPGHNVPY